MNATAGNGIIHSVLHGLDFGSEQSTAQGNDRSSRSWLKWLSALSLTIS
jgi:hypothetical protein